MKRNPSSGQFQPGHSGNPGGRPAGVAVRIRQATENGEVLIQRLIDLATGAVPDTKPADQLKALEILLDRGFGRATFSQPADDQTPAEIEAEMAERDNSARFRLSMAEW